MSDQVADVLDDAADVLERDGWIQGAMHDTLGHCAEGALAHICSDVLQDRSGLWGRASAAIERLTAECVITEWNDTPGRTKQEVLDAFRLAAKHERMDNA